MRKVEERFRVVHRDAIITGEKYRINEQYLLAHPTKSQQALDIHTQYEGRQIFATQEICVYEGPELRAFSFYDLGADSAYSKAGIYDPAYAEHSLGLYTMYAEVKACQAAGQRYYYPGYISPDTPLFDYKKRLGNLEFWHSSAQQWLPLNQFEEKRHSPVKIIYQKIKDLSHALDKLEQIYSVCDYLFFEMPLMYQQERRFVDSPLICLIHCPQPRTCWVVIYNLNHNQYECWHTVFEQAITFFDEGASDKNYFRYVLQKDRLLYLSDHVSDMALRIKELLKGQDGHLVPKER